VDNDSDDIVVLSRRRLKDVFGIGFEFFCSGRIDPNCAKALLNFVIAFFALASRSSMRVWSVGKVFMLGTWAASGYWSQVGKGCVYVAVEAGVGRVGVYILEKFDAEIQCAVSSS
jgi:hypothetical protein